MVAEPQAVSDHGIESSSDSRVPFPAMSSFVCMLHSNPKLQSQKIKKMDIPVEVGVSPTLGIRGLLAVRDIAVGEVIERSPVVLFRVEHERFLETSILRNYYYLWDERSFALALGYGSLYNHSLHANVDFKCDFETQTITYTAAKPIRRGDELTVNYNGDPDDVTPLDPAVWW